MSDYVWLHNLGFGMLFSIAGALFIIAGLLILRSSYLKTRTWITVSGTVIGYKEMQQGRRYDSQGKINNRLVTRSDPEPAQWTAYDPQVQFTTADGKMVTFTSSSGSNIKFHRIGDAVQVVYDPEHPENATIKSFSNLFLVAIVAIVLGVIFLGIAVRPIFFK